MKINSNVLLNSTFLLIVTLLPRHSFALLEVSDPAQTIDQVSHFVGQNDFESSFKQGDQWIGVSRVNWGEIKNLKRTVEILYIENNTAYFETRVEGMPTTHSTFSKAEYERQSGNPLQYYLDAYLDFYLNCAGTITVSPAQPIKYPIAGQNKTLNALSVKVTLAIQASDVCNEGNYNYTYAFASHPMGIARTLSVQLEETDLGVFAQDFLRP